MKKNNTLKPLRIDSELKELIDNAKKKIEDKLGFEIKKSVFVRWALKDFSHRVISEGIEISIKDTLSIQ